MCNGLLANILAVWARCTSDVVLTAKVMESSAPAGIKVQGITPFGISHRLIGVRLFLIAFVQHVFSLLDNNRPAKVSWRNIAITLTMGE